MVLQRIKKFLSYWYLQYLLATSVYMLEPLERGIFNSLLVGVIAMFIYTSYVFLPGHARMLLYFVENYLLGIEQRQTEVHTQL